MAASVTPGTAKAVRWTLAGGLVATVATAAIVTWTWSPPQPGLKVGEAAPPGLGRLSSAVAGGEPLSLDDLRGRGVLLNFWATWCDPCVKELPLLAALHEKYVGKHFTVVAVTDDDPAAVAAFLATRPLPFPVLLDPESRLRARLGADDALPYTVFLGPDGTIAAKKVGQLQQVPAAQQIERLIVAARAAARAP
jgi:thiol-disulfide isomerase/thioredoxin